MPDLIANIQKIASASSVLPVQNLDHMIPEWRPDLREFPDFRLFAPRPERRLDAVLSEVADVSSPRRRRVDRLLERDLGEHATII